MSSTSRLDGRVALVTGASSGIGRATALLLAAQGASVVLSGRNLDRLQQVANQVGGDALVIPGDVSDEVVARKVVADTVERFGRLDILVNAAGVMEIGGVSNADTGQWRQLIDVNLMGPLYTSTAAVEQMKAQGSGDIINVSSVAGRKTTGGSGSYCTSKSALITMSEGLRQEVGSLGIRVCVIEPGATNTSLFEGVSNPQIREGVRQQLTMDGVMEAEDVAETILFVVSLPGRVNISELLIRPTMDVK